MWEARDKATKTTGSRDPTACMDYSPVWLRRDYWESLCHCWATGPWQERSQVAKRNRATHPEKNRHELERAPTFRELFDRTHKRKGTDDYVSESACTIAETYDRMMADRYAEGTPSQTWIQRLGSTQREGRGRVECMDLGTAWKLLQCCSHMRVRSLLWPTQVHLLRRPAVVERT
ncbi:hypothetical protein Taro_041795 [Colocasia esculenta]|uniref:Uncharacterized protein n=1 Tax=Colocasia esculenta TaxID=4460 RepID=A0A843WMC9_COLES|nr:hypothetical protein [Colocasia esculenta]